MITASPAEWEPTLRAALAQECPGDDQLLAELMAMANDCFRARRCAERGSARLAAALRCRADWPTVEALEALTTPED